MTRLSELLENAIGDIEPTFDSRDIRGRVQRRRRGARVRRSIGAVLVVVVLGIATVVFLTGQRSPSRDVRVQPSGLPGNTSDVVAFDDNGGISTAAFDSRTATHYPLAGWRPGDQPFLSLRVGNDFVAGWGNVYATPISGKHPQPLGSGVFVPAVEPNAVWLTSYGQVQTPTERLVDMRGKVLLQGRVPTDTAGHPYIAVTGLPGGLAVQTPTGLGRWDPRTGRITHLVGTSSALTALPVSGSLLAWCEHCDRSLEITDLANATTRSVPVSLNGGFLTVEQYFGFSPDRTTIAVAAQPDGAAPLGATTKIVIVDVTTGKVAEQIDTHARYATLAWSADSKRLYIAATNSGNGGRVLVHDRSNNTTRDLGPVPDESGRIASVVTRDDATRLPVATASCLSPPSPITLATRPCTYKF